MREIKERALFERAKRSFAKDGLILHKHKAGNRDHVMNGDLYAYTADPTNNNLMVGYWDYSTFINICKENSILKADETVQAS